MNRKSKEKVLNQKEVGINSFMLYESTNDFTKEVNGKLKIESFHLYKEKE